MSTVAIVFLIISVTLIWGGLLASVVFLARQPEVETYPEGGEDAEQQG